MPNPSKKDFNLKVFTTEMEAVNVTIIDAQGRKISSFILQPAEPLLFGNGLTPAHNMLKCFRAKPRSRNRLLSYNVCYLHQLTMRI